MGAQYFRKENFHPLKPPALDSVGSMIHSVSAAKGILWADAYGYLIEAAGTLGLMPQTMQTMREALRLCGFFPVSGARPRKTVREMIDLYSEQFTDGEAVILKTGSIFVPLVHVKHEKTARYVLMYPSDKTESLVSEVWIAWRDGQDHRAKPQKCAEKTVSVRENRTQENESLVIYNENPNGNLIGDCAVRAVAGVLEIPWGEAVRRLAAAQDYTETIINTVDNIEALLRKEGFEPFDAIRRNGRILTGKQFCDLIHDMFQAGTRIFGYVGNSHVVAILVFDGDYKIVDTWDSTDRLITKYWAKYPERPRRREKPPQKPEPVTALYVGMQLRHSMYGCGTVTALRDSTATVRFASGTEKQFAAEWILANCKL